MSKGKTPAIPARTDITEARLKMIARDACFYCYGRKIHDHDPRGLTVVATEKLDVVRKDVATALFRMDRGAVIVMIKGIDQLRWFWPTVDSARAAYDICQS